MIFKLTKFEFINYVRSHQILRSSIYMMLLALLLFSIIIPAEMQNDKIKLLTSYAAIIFAIMIVPTNIIKSDLKDGFLETILTIYSPNKIVMAKYLALILNLVLSCLILAPIIELLYQISLYQMLYLYSLMILTIMQISIILVFVNLLHAYFKRNTNFLIALILPIIIPTIMIASLALSSLNTDFLMILLGIDLILIPTTFLLSSYLLKNLFNI